MCTSKALSCFWFLDMMHYKHVQVGGASARDLPAMSWLPADAGIFLICLCSQSGRVSYRALKLQLPLDDALLAVLKDEIVDVLQLAVDQEGGTGAAGGDCPTGAWLALW
jgi:hypothetical protein